SGSDLPVGGNQRHACKHERHHNYEQPGWFGHRFLSSKGIGDRITCQSKAERLHSACRDCTRSGLQSDLRLFCGDIRKCDMIVVEWTEIFLRACSADSSSISLETPNHDPRIPHFIPGRAGTGEVVRATG